MKHILFTSFNGRMDVIFGWSVPFWGDSAAKGVLVRVRSL
jgi:hypothetical protein